jgi:hypothetical protein
MTTARLGPAKTPDHPLAIGAIGHALVKGVTS